MVLVTSERGVCVSCSPQAVSEEREGEQETVRASIRKTACWLKSQTRGNKEKRRGKKKSETHTGNRKLAEGIRTENYSTEQSLAAEAPSLALRPL